MLNTYNLENKRKELPQLQALSEEEKIKGMFYLGIITFMEMMTKASQEPEVSQAMIMDILHDEVDTEATILLSKFRKEF